jgi:tetratricopeptide (TPR) repeat protein
MVTPEPHANGAVEPVVVAGWPASIPKRLGIVDIARIEATTRDFRAVDHQYGGGACHDAVVAFLSWSQRLLGIEATDAVTDRLHVALADLHNLAGWTAFDINRLDAAGTHLDQALMLARTGRNDDLIANISYRQGRIHLHHGNLEQALADFEFGHHAARTSGSTLTAAILHANQAWASAKLGRTDDTLKHLGNSMTDLARTNAATAPAWAGFFDSTELSAMSGVIYTELAQTVDPAYTRDAIPALTIAADGYGPAMARSKSFVLIALATSHLLQDDIDHAATVGAEAIGFAETVRSSRIHDRLLPLKREADRRRHNTNARELSEQIVTFTTLLPAPAGQPTHPATRITRDKAHQNHDQFQARPAPGLHGSSA